MNTPTRNIIHSPEELPSCLQNRSGWADWLEFLRNREPHVHQIEPTNHCPFTCVMCPRTKKMTRSLGFMEWALYQKLIDEIATFSEPVRFKEIELFHFGESLLHPQLAKMVALAASHKLHVTLSVNPPYLTPRKAEELLLAGPYKLIVSIDGYDAASYQEIRGKVASFEKAEKNMDTLVNLLSKKNYATQVVVRIIEMNANSAYLSDMRTYWEAKGFTVEVRSFFPWAEKELTSLGQYEKLPPLMPCPFPWQYLVVQWDGNVVPCCRHYNAENIMGNIRTQSLREIWNSALYSKFREQHKTGEFGDNKKCKTCTEIYYNDPKLLNISGRY